MTTLTATRISLELGCSPGCNNLVAPLYAQMASGNYDECAVMPIPADVVEWRADNRTARKRADRAQRRGYRFAFIERHRRVDEIFQINRSADERQGRPMAESYRLFPNFSPLPFYGCGRHCIRTYGLESSRGRLVAYMAVYRAGQLCLISQILGHADFLEDEIMYLLFQGAVGVESEEPDGWFVYNRWDSGTEGLRFFKARLGFDRADVEWVP